ncbi:hypothetical protein EDC14_101183 [Hydrogenispora ethanolica]|jgi:hypothetical protein|uniref:Uncharacterized protein n=1 Tax=Hydrogenispora ethanolica TaxID=1082276 RepID=A0A4R1RTU5_HYDET|nr:hypothetical protein [Hydrogenispora ethanolica]TCL69961.1 hypothetical protein EDC14_101183 [Hydrogenispora ethanolica]
MNEQTAFDGALLRRFYDSFRTITYHRVPVFRYLHYSFLFFARNRWKLNWAKDNLPGLKSEMAQITDTALYHQFDEPYQYDPHPDGVILMRGGFGDIASSHLPKERFVLLSPNQAEVDVIHRNRPDLAALNIESYYRPNPRAVELLNQQIAKVIQKQQNDPIFGSADLLRWLYGKTPEIVRVFDAVHSIFETLNIGAVLTISSIVWMDCALNLFAKANRIPSFTLQHGLIVERDLFCHIPIGATQKMVWGNAVAQWYQKLGFPASRLSVIGSPRFDVIFNRKWCGKQELCQKLGINPTQKIMVYATGTEMKTIVPLIVNGLRSIPGLYLVMLLHPAESALVPQYEQLAAGYSNCKVVRFGQISLYDALSGADFFITHCSTAGLEAMLFQLPVITVEPLSSYFSYGELGASLRVTTSAELNETILKLMNDADFRKNAIQRYQQFIAQYCIPDGDASKRLFDQLKMVCRSGGVV